MKKKIYVVVFAILILLWGISGFVRDYFELRNNSKYQIAEIIGCLSGNKGNTGVVYRFYVDGKEYFGVYGKIDYSIIGNKYLVVYSSTKPVVNVMYLEIPITDTIPKIESLPKSILWKLFNTGGANGRENIKLSP